MLKFLGYMAQLMLSPANGWEDISKAGRDPEQLKSDGLFPLLGIAGASAFCQLIYSSQLTLVGAIERAIVIFMMYFATFFLAQYLMPKAIENYVSTEVNSTRVNTFIVYCIALSALITIVENLLPIEVSIVQFLPILVAFVMWRGLRYLDISTQSAGKFMICAIGIILLPPILLHWFLNMIIL